MFNLLACLAAGFFILGLVYRLQHRAMLPRLIGPYFLSDILRYRRAPGISRWLWTLTGNVVLAGVIIGIVVIYHLAALYQSQWPSHNFSGAQISAGLGKIYIVYCGHGLHMAAIWLVRWVIFATVMNLFTSLSMSWEDCRSELLTAFVGNKFFQRGQAKIALYAPYSYLLKTASPFTIAQVFDKLDAIQRSGSVHILGCGNAPPSGIMILASRKGLPVKTFGLRDLPIAQSPRRFCIGLSPVPVWWNFAAKPHAGIVGPTGAGKSNLARALCAAANIADVDTINIFVDIEGVDWQLPSLPNVVMISDVVAMARCFQLIEDERLRRVHLLLQGGRRLGLTNVSDLSDSLRWTNPTKLPRILLMFDEFAATNDLHSEAKSFKKAMKLFRSFVTRGRKYGISVVAVTTRADFEAFKSSRDEFRWLGVGAFRERAGAMIFEQDVSGWNRLGSFRYELEEPYQGLGVAMAPEVPLAGTVGSLAGILTQCSARCSPLTRELGEWFQREIHRVQDREELEKVQESLVAFVNQT